VIHLRLVVPSDLVPQVLALLDSLTSALNLVHLAGVARDPDGDLVLADVAREDASSVIARLQELGLGERGSIATIEIDAAISRRAEAAEQAAAGAPADAVVWEQVEARTSESAVLSGSFLAFMILATMIAAVGIVTDSIILIIGAMIVGPEFGPLAGLCVALVQRRRKLARRSLAALLVGFPVAIVTTYLATVALKAVELFPAAIGEHKETLFISDPNRYSVLVAALAGVAGMVSLTTAKAGALIGVLVSVTTIPAAANVGVAAVYGDWEGAIGAATQLAINLSAIVASGVVVLWVMRRARRRRLRGRIRGGGSGGSPA
jgi:uncharacterized hydrophobic protein (TIGR00271 family)